MKALSNEKRGHTQQDQKKEVSEEIIFPRARKTIDLATLNHLLQNEYIEPFYYCITDTKKASQFLFTQKGSMLPKPVYSLTVPVKKAPYLKSLLGKVGLTENTSCPPNLAKEFPIITLESSWERSRTFVIGLTAFLASCIGVTTGTGIHTKLLTRFEDFDSGPVLTDDKAISTAFREECQKVSCGLKDNALPEELLRSLDGMGRKAIAQMAKDITTLKGKGYSAQAAALTLYLDQGIKDRSSIQPLTPEDAKVVHTHEHGHAIIRLVTGKYPHYVSFQQREEDLGAVGDLVPSERTPVNRLTNRQTLLKDILYSIGGRAAEKVFLGVAAVTDGSESDISGAREAARKLVQEGMLLGDAGIEPSSPEFSPVVENILQAAFIAEEHIFSLLTAEEMDKVVSDTLSKGSVVLAFNEVQEYYDSHLPSLFLSKARTIEEKFCRDPFSFLK